MCVFVCILAKHHFMHTHSCTYTYTYTLRYVWAGLVAQVLVDAELAWRSSRQRDCTQFSLAAVVVASLRGGRML